MDSFIWLRFFAREQAGGGAGEDFRGVWERVFVEIEMGVVMAGGEVRADHQVGGLSAVGLHALHEISEILTDAEVAVAYDFGEDAQFFCAFCDESGEIRRVLAARRAADFFDGHFDAVHGGGGFEDAPRSRSHFPISVITPT